MTDDHGFTITKVGDAVCEVLLQGVAYRYEARPGYSKIEASKDGEPLERSEMTSAHNETRLTTWHRAEITASFVTSIEAGEVSTNVDVRGRSYKIRSDERNHSAELATVLAGVKAPSMPHIRRFAREYTKNADFRDALAERQMAVPLNGGSVFCGIVCSCCLILVPDPVPGDEIPCCIACANCLVG